MTLSWAARRNVKLWLIWLTFLFIGAQAFRLVWILLVPKGTDPISFLANAAGALGIVFESNAVKSWLSSHPILTTYLAGAVIFGFLLHALVGEWIHDRVFASYNDDVLQQLPSNNPIANTADQNYVRLDWQEGAPGGLRDQAWQGLTDWANQLIERKRFARFDNRYKEAIIVGRAGSGKSRLAAEFGNTLARRGRNRPEKWHRRVRIATGAWLRRTIPGLRPAPGDPWDVGILRLHTGERNPTQDLSGLAEWKPRRPTLIILDDPAPGDAGKYHQILSDGKFNHPVALLIANQTVPSGTQFGYDQEKRLWTYDRGLAEPQPFMLPADSWFTEVEVRKIVIPLLQHKPESTRKEVRDGDMFRLTHGNPLLLELALEWLETNDTLKNLYPERLKSERASRIIDALKAADITDRTEFAILIAATLAGGADRDRLKKEFDAEGLPTHGRLFDLDIADYKACFPTDQIRLATGTTIPAIRPDMIVAAFVDAVEARNPLGDYLPKIIRAAFRTRLSATLRSVRFVPPDSALGRALAAIDPNDIDGISALDWAIVYAEAAIMIEHDDLGIWTQKLQDERTAAADVAIAGLNPDEAVEFAHHMAGLAKDRYAQIEQGCRVQPNVLLRCVHLAAAQISVLLDAGYWTDLYCSIVKLFGPRDKNTDLGPMDGLVRSAICIANDLDHSALLFNAIWGVPDQIKSVYAPVMKALLPDSGDEIAQLLGANLEAHIATLAADGAEAEIAKNAADRAEIIAQRNSGNWNFGFQAAMARCREAHAWSDCPGGRNADLAHEAAKRVLEFTEKITSNALVQRIATEALRHEAWAWRERPDGSGAESVKSVNEMISTFVERFPTDANICGQAITALRYEVEAWGDWPLGQHAEEAHRAATKLQAIADKFSEHIHFQIESAESWRHVAWAWCNVPDGLGVKQASIAREKVNFVASKYPLDQRFVLELIESSRHEASAFCKIPNGMGYASMQCVVDQILDVTNKFPIDPLFQIQAAFALKLCAMCHSERSLGEGSAEANIAANKALLIAQKFSNDIVMNTVAAETLRLEARAWAARPLGIGAERASVAADRAQNFATHFHDVAAIQREAAMARGCEAEAWTEQGTLSALRRAEETLRQVRVLRPTSGDNSILDTGLLAIQSRIDAARKQNPQ